MSQARVQEVFGLSCLKFDLALIGPNLPKRERQRLQPVLVRSAYTRWDKMMLHDKTAYAARFAFYHLQMNLNVKKSITISYKHLLCDFTVIYGDVGAIRKTLVSQIRN